MKQAKLFGEEEPMVLTKLELAKAQILAKQVESIVKPLCDKLEVVGSIRRQKPMVGDVDFVAVGTESNWGKIVQALKKAKVICAGQSVIKLNYPYENSLFQVDFYRATEQTFGIQALIRTGSADHNMWLASYALSKGFRLKYNEGLIKDKVAVAGETEESVFIHNLTIKDQDVFEIISDQKELERAEFIKRSLKVGAIALRGVVAAEKIDYLKREFELLCYDLDNIFQQKLGKEGMKGELDKVFGDEGKLHGCLEKLFGDDGKLVRDILYQNNIKSPIGQLRKTIESYFVGRDSQMYGMLDPNSKDSPMARLRQDILQKLDAIENSITVYLAQKQVIDKAPKKGFDFEDVLEEFLLMVSKPYGDVIEKTGKEKGKLNNLKGDFVITLCDPTIKGRAPKIVVEAKTLANVRLAIKGLVGELREALENRDACFAIAVTDKAISEGAGCYREMEGDKIICTFEDKGLPLEVAYRIARSYILMKQRETPQKTIDTRRICGVVSKIGNDLNAIKGIKAKLTSINNATETIGSDMKTLETNIRASLDELQAIIHQGTDEE